LIGLDIKPPVAAVTLRRPPVNAQNAAWVERMNGVLDEAESHGDVSVCHIRSAQKVFCAGADLETMGDLLASQSGRDRMIEAIRGLQALFSRLEASRLVTVAEIGGAAVGGGCELALACDLRVIAESAPIGLPEVRLGLLPAAGGTQRLSRICGDAVARRLILSAELVKGQEALWLGMVHWALPSAQVAEFAADLVARIGSLPGGATAASKNCIADYLDDSKDGFERELIETRRLHDELETQSLVKAFLSKNASHE